MVSQLGIRKICFLIVKIFIWSEKWGEIFTLLQAPACCSVIMSLKFERYHFLWFTLFSGAGNHLATGLHFTPTVIEGRCYFWQMKGSKISVILWLSVLPWSMFVLNYTDSESWRKLLGLKDDGLIRNYCTSAFPTYAANRLADSCTKQLNDVKICCM